MTAHNWVFLRAEDNFKANFELLIDALETDLDHVREHTRLLTRAIEWDQDQRSKGLAIEIDTPWPTSGLTPLADSSQMEFRFQDQMDLNSLAGVGFE